MKPFLKSEAYIRFKEDLQGENRFFMSDESLKFLNDRYESAVKNNLIVDLEPSSPYKLWRARKGCKSATDIAKDMPYQENDLIPRKEHIKRGGRANSVNVPYLYLNVDPEGAVAEVRPLLFEPVSVGLFKPKRTLKILDLSFNRHNFDEAWRVPYEEGRLLTYKKNDFKKLSNGFLGGVFKSLEPSITEKEIDDYIWLVISAAFSYPVHDDDSERDYLPTQAIAEFFKSKEIDGINFMSQFESRLIKDEVEKDGPQKQSHNIVLFDLNSVTFERSYIYKLQSQLLTVEKISS